MKSKYDKLLQRFADMSYDELLAAARAALRDFWPVAQQIDREHGGRAIIVPLIAAAVTADGKFSEREGRFIRDLLGIDGDEAYAMFSRLRDGKIFDAADSFIDSLSVDQRSAVLTVMMCVTAVDETITSEENALLDRLLE